MLGIVLLMFIIAVTMISNASRPFSERHPDRAAILKGLQEKYGYTEEWFKEHRLMGKNDFLD